MKWLLLLIYSKEITQSAKGIEAIASRCLREKRLPNTTEEKDLLKAAGLLIKIGMMKASIDDNDLDTIMKTFKD